MKNKTKPIKVSKGDIVRSKKLQFNDYERNPKHPFFGEDKLRPALIVDEINDSGYYLITFGTTKSKADISFETEKGVITLNSSDTFVFNNEKLISAVESHFVKVGLQWKKYKLLEQKIENQIPRKNLIKEIISCVENKNYKEANLLVEKQFDSPTEQEIRIKNIYSEAKQFSSVKEREEFINQKKSVSTNEVYFGDTLEN